MTRLHDESLEALRYKTLYIISVTKTFIPKAARHCHCLLRYIHDERGLFPAKVFQGDSRNRFNHNQKKMTVYIFVMAIDLTWVYERHFFLLNLSLPNSHRTHLAIHFMHPDTIPSNSSTFPDLLSHKLLRDLHQPLNPSSTPKPTSTHPRMTPSPTHHILQAPRQPDPKFRQYPGQRSARQQRQYHHQQLHGMPPRIVHQLP